MKFKVFPRWTAYGETGEEGAEFELLKKVGFKFTQHSFGDNKYWRPVPMELELGFLHELGAIFHSLDQCCLIDFHNLTIQLQARK